MNRTRLIFFGFLALYLGIIATTLALNVANSSFLQQIYIGSTIFSIGVVLMDFLGILGGHHDGDTAGDVIAGDVTAGHLGGGHDGGMHLGTAHGQGDGHADAGHAPGDQAATHDSGETHPAASQQSSAPFLSVLSYLRLFVYFCLGFGPMGWVAMASGRSALASLVLAIPVGVAAVFLAQAFFRFQRRDTDSQLAGADLIGQTATVIVPLDDKTMGKVRAQVGPVVTERYALAAKPGAAFEDGAQVVITSVTDECIYVR